MRGTRRIGHIRPFVLSVLIAVVVISLRGTHALAHEAPVDHVNRQMQMWVADGRLFLRYRVELTDRMAMMQLAAADSDVDGKTSDGEFEAMLKRVGERVRASLKLELAGRAVEWEQSQRAKLDARLGQTFVFSTPLPKGVTAAAQGRLSDEYSRLYPGAFRYLNATEAPAGARAMQAELEAGTETLTGDHPAMMVIRFRLPLGATAPATQPAAR